MISRLVLPVVAAAFFFSPSLPALADPLIQLMAGDIGQSRPSDCPRRWCACYLERILAEAGFMQRGSNLARDFASYGAPADPGEPGAIMVMRGHVGVVTGRCEDGTVQIVSGNYSNQVGVGCYAATKAIAWREPVK